MASFGAVDWGRRLRKSMRVAGARSIQTAMRATCRSISSGLNWLLAILSSSQHAGKMMRIGYAKRNALRYSRMNECESSAALVSWWLVGRACCLPRPRLRMTSRLMSARVVDATARVVWRPLSFPPRYDSGTIVRSALLLCACVRGRKIPQSCWPDLQRPGLLLAP